MENSESKQKKLTCSWIACCTKGFPVSSYKSMQSSESEYDEKEKYHGGDLPESKTAKRKPGGWRAMPFVLGFSLPPSHSPSLSLTPTHTQNMHSPTNMCKVESCTNTCQIVTTPSACICTFRTEKKELKSCIYFIFPYSLFERLMADLVYFYRK